MARAAQRILNNDKIFMCKCTVVIFFISNQRDVSFLNPHSIRNHMPVRKLSLESQSQGHKSGRQDALPTCSVTVQKLTQSMSLEVRMTLA